MTAACRESRSALEHARLYRRKGWNVLPTRMDEKRPMVRFAHLWEEMAPDGWFTDSGWFDTGCIQVMTGRHWGLAAIDLDGPEAIEAWSTLGRPLPRTWESSSGGGGRHVWYRLPPGLPPMPKRVVWGGVEKHRAIEVLCDRSLLMAPPSIHPKTGRVYRFLPGHSPRDLNCPAVMPKWVVDLPEADARPPSAPRQALAPVVRKAPLRPLPGGVRRDDVLAAIPDKIAVARSWGLRIVSATPGPSGFVDCHDFDRPDVHPSARFHPQAGLFWRPGGRSLSLFDLGAAMGHYATWLDCCADLASTHMPRARG